MPEPRIREVQAECVNKRLTSVGGSSQDETPESVPPVEFGEAKLGGR